jgi:hypothetical protein
MLNYNRFLPALLLAIVMLTGCKEPVGLPRNDVHAAATDTTYCWVDSLDPTATGRVEMDVDGSIRYNISYGVIRRAYEETGGLPDPKTYGFCVFNVPDFESPNAVPVCTLYYYQTSRTGYLNLVFKWLPDVESWPPAAASVLYNAIDTSSYALAPTQDYQDNGWRKLALSNEGSAWLEGCAGASLVTGWKHTNAVDGWQTDVAGVDDPSHLPFIKVVYYPN